MRKTANDSIPGVVGPLVNIDFYSADVAPTAGQIYTTPSNVVYTNGADAVILKCKANGANASSAGTVTFTIVGSYDGTTFETVGTTVVLTLTTNTLASVLAQLDTRNMVALKVTQIVNGDASYALAAVNVHGYALQ